VRIGRHLYFIEREGPRAVPSMLRRLGEETFGKISSLRKKGLLSQLNQREGNQRTEDEEKEG